MTTSTPVIVSDAPQPIYLPGPLRSRFAKRFLELSGNDKRATRLDQCGRHRDLRDKNNHQKREYQHCMDPFCRYCSVYLARGTFKRWESTLTFLEATDKVLPSTITFIEVTLPLKRDRATAERFLSTACDMLGGENPPGWTLLVGYKDSSATLRMLVLDDDDRDICNAHYIQSWAEKFPPQATVKVTIHPLTDLQYVFRSKLLALDISDDSNGRAEQSALFAGMRRFRPIGIRILSPEAERELFAKSDVSANISPEELQSLEDTVIPPSPPGRDICPHCGEKFTEESQWFGADAPEPREGERRWYPRH